MRVQELLDRLSLSAKLDGWERGSYGVIGDYTLPVFTRAAAGDSMGRVLMTAGVHGDEPAGPLAVLELLRKKALPRHLDYALLPVINPLGCEDETRENADGVDVNRSYGPTPGTEEARLEQAWLADQQWDLALCLHEDFDASGFYLYELAPGLPGPTDWSAQARPSPAREIIAAATEHLSIEYAPEVDGLPNDRGLMQPPREHLADWRADLPEAIHLYYHHAPWCFTFETPSTGARITERVAGQVAATLASLHHFFPTYAS